MGISQEFFLFVAGFGILQAFFLAGILYFHPRSEKSVNAFLALYIFFLVLPMFTPVIQHLFSWQTVSLTEPVILLIGPFLYLYVLSLKESITWRKAYPHFILYVAALSFGIYMYYKLSGIYPPSKEPPVEVLRSPTANIRSAIRILQMVFYFFLARRTLSSYQNSIQNLYSETSRINFKWVRWLINGYMLLVVVMIIVYLFMLKYPQHFNLLLLLNTAIIAPYIYLVTYKGLTQPMLWQLHPGMARNKVQEEIHKIEEITSTSSVQSKSSKPVLSSEKMEEILRRTISLMERDKLYQETELNLQQLAERLQIPSYVVSQAINEGLNKTFYDLVNGYRVEEAKRLLLDPNNRNYKILSVGFEAGFNSKTTFNTVFKKFTGLSPTEYREKHITTVTQI